MSQYRRLSKSSPGRQEKPEGPKGGKDIISGGKAWHYLRAAKLKVGGVWGR